MARLRKKRHPAPPWPRNQRNRCATPRLQIRTARRITCLSGKQRACRRDTGATILGTMIITHTQNAQGHTRIYLGGRGSLECWIEPNADKTTWRFLMAEAVTGNQITDDDKRQHAVHTLFQLAKALDVSPGELAAVPYEMIAGLHDTDPFAGRRVAAPKRRTLEQGYMSTTPDIRRPASDFRCDRQSGPSRHRS